MEDIENSPGGSRPKTPGARGSRARTVVDEDDDDIVVSGSTVTPMKRVPILANFEEWMKMATDNKINANNSWNFALIDYFHDMSLLKEGDGVNFQKASCTLDGCVKIYTSRVDSVATETGKLLSGLADSNNKKRDRDGEGNEGEESEEDEVDEDGNVRKKPKRKVCDTQPRVHAEILTLNRRNVRQRPLLHLASRHSNSRSSSLSSPWIPYSRRPPQTLTRAAPRACSLTTSW